VAAAVIEERGCFLVTKRPAGVHLEGCWEFPGGKCEPEESHEACLRRELREELDVEVCVSDRILAVSHAYPHRTVELHFYRCDMQGEPRPLLGQQMRWVPRGELASLPFPPADAELIARLAG
jgi:mutator protein MutT